MSVPVANSPILVIRRPTLTLRNDDYWCKHCGELNSGVVNYSETVFGTATLVNLDSDLDDYETTDTDNFEITEVRCRNCDERRDSIDELFASEDPQINE